MVFGFNLLGSPHDNSVSHNSSNSNTRNGGFEFTPIGKRRETEDTSFHVIHSYPQDQQQQQQQPRMENRRGLLRPLKESNNLYHQSPSGLFDETIDDFENPSPTRSPIKPRLHHKLSGSKEKYEFNGQKNNGYAAKQAEETIKELRSENIGWKIKYKEILRSLDNMPLTEREIRMENIALKETLALSNQENQRLRNDSNTQNRNDDSAEIRSLKAKINELSNARMEDDEIIRALRLEREDLMKKVDNLQGFMEHSSTEFDELLKREKADLETIASLKSKLETLQNGKVEEQNNSKFAFDNEIERLNGEIKLLKTNEHEAHKQEAVLKQSIDEHARDINKLQTQIRQKEDLIISLKSDLIKQTSNNDVEQDFESKLQHHQNLLESKQNELDQQDEEIQQLKFDLQIMTKKLNMANQNSSKNSGNEEEIRHLQNINDELNEQISMERAQMHQLKIKLKKFDEIKDQINFYEAEFDKVNNELKSKTKELQEHKQKLLDDETEIYDMKLNKLKNTIREKDSSLSKLTSQISQFEIENKRLISKVEKLQSSSQNVDTLKHENIELNHEIGSYKQEINDLEKELRRLKLDKDIAIPSGLESRLKRDIEILKEKQALLMDENEDLRQDLETNERKLNHARHMDNNGLINILSELETAKLKVEEELTDLQTEHNELLEILEEQEQKIEARFSQQIIDLTSKIRSCDEYIDKLESQVRSTDINNRKIDDLQYDLMQSKEVIESQETKIKQLQEEFSKKINDKTNSTAGDEFLKFQLRTLKGDFETATNKLKFTEERHKSQLLELENSKQQTESQLSSVRSQIQELEQTKQQTESQLNLVKSENKKLKQDLSSSETDGKKWLSYCKILGEKYSNMKQLYNKSSSPEWNDFLSKESYYFKQRYQECTLAKSSVISMYNFVIESIKKSQIGMDNSNLIKLGICPEPKAKSKLTFKGLAKFVLASVVLRKKGENYGKRRKELDSIRTDLKIARIQFN